MRRFFATSFSALLLCIPLFGALHAVPVHADKNDPLGLSFTQNSGLPGTDEAQPDIRIKVANMINTLLGLLGLLAVILVLYAGFTWMTAAGNEEKVKKAQQTLIRATIGIVIILSAYIITNFIVTQIYKAVQ